MAKLRRATHERATTRATATGAAVSGKCVVWWMTIAPSAAATVLDISDGTATGTTIWTWGDQSGDGVHLVFDPGWEFDTGVYIETLTNITSVTICYSTV